MSAQPASFPGRCRAECRHHLSLSGTAKCSVDSLGFGFAVDTSFDRWSFYAAGAGLEVGSRVALEVSAGVSDTDGYDPAAFIGLRFYASMGD